MDHIWIKETVSEQNGRVDWLVAGRHSRNMGTQQTVSNSESCRREFVDNVGVTRVTVAFEITLRPQFETVEIYGVPP